MPKDLEWQDYGQKLFSTLWLGYITFQPRKARVINITSDKKAYAKQRSEEPISEMGQEQIRKLCQAGKYQLIFFSIYTKNQN